MIGPSSWGNCGAFGGTRTPNLLIRSLVPVVRLVRSCPFRLVRVRRASSMDAQRPAGGRPLALGLGQTGCVGERGRNQAPDSAPRVGSRRVGFAAG
jgi:hypothetical protein